MLLIISVATLEVIPRGEALVLNEVASVLSKVAVITSAFPVRDLCSVCILPPHPLLDDHHTSSSKPQVVTLTKNHTYEVTRIHRFKKIVTSPFLFL